MHTTRTIRVISCIALLALMASFQGCTGHGTHTAKQVSSAKAKMDAMKSATEWQTARQAFLGGDMNKALKHVDASIALNPEVAKSHVLRGRVQMELANFEQASRSFARAEQIDEKNVDAQYYSGILAEQLNRQEEALKRFQKAAELDTENAQYVIAAAETLIDLGRLDEARDYLNSRSGSFENNAGVKQTLGHIAAIEGEHATAAQFFSQARLLAPDEPSILEDLARAQANSRDYAAAESNLSRLLATEANKNRRDLQLLRAHCLVKTDRPIEAREILMRLTRDQNGASDAQAWTALGNVSFILRDYPRMKTAASRVVAIAPSSPDGYLLRALYFREQSDFAAAETNLKQALSLEQKPDTFVLLGLIQRQQGNEEGARRSFQAALQMDPGAENASRLLTSVPGGE